MIDLECYHHTCAFSDATFGDVQFLVTETMVCPHLSYAMATVAIHHYKSLLVKKFECHYNTYTFGDATIGDV